MLGRGFARTKNISLHFVLRRATFRPISPSMWSERVTDSHAQNTRPESMIKKILLDSDSASLTRLKSKKLWDAGVLKSTVSSSTNSFFSKGDFSLKRSVITTNRELFAALNVEPLRSGTNAVVGWKEPLFKTGISLQNIYRKNWVMKILP